MKFQSNAMKAVVDPHIPGYRIEGLIGSGGMASVYLAIQESLERPVALKVLDDPESPEYQERFLNEGRIIASLNHSNIITVHDIGYASRHLYISMEYVEGGDLRRRIREGMTPPEAFEIIEEIGNALKLAHSKGVVHRDVKPANILFRLDGTPLLADFGIAKDHQRDSDLTMDGSVVGSPYYLSPELARAQDIDGRADIYSLGIILFEMLTGEKPFKGESAVDSVFKHLNDPVPTLPEELVRLQYIIDKSLAKMPADRFADMDEMLEAVAEARARGFADIADRMVKGTDTMLLEATWVKNASKKKRSMRSRLVRFLATAAGVSALAVGAWLYFAAGELFSGAPTTTRGAESKVAGGGSEKVTHVASLEPVVVADPTDQPPGTPSSATKTSLSTPQHSGTNKKGREPSAAGVNASKKKVTVASAAAPKSTTSKSPATRAKTKPSKKATKPKPVAKRKPKPVAPPARPRKTARQIEIEHYVRQANLRLYQGKLSKPLGDSAKFYRDQILAVDPGNPAAERLSKAIADSYERLARKELKQGDYLAATGYIDDGLKVQPHHDGLRWLKENALKYSAKGLFDRVTRSILEAKPRAPVNPGSSADRK